MTLRKFSRILLYTSATLVLVQIPWYPITQYIVDRTLVKTTATVIGFKSYAANCTYKSFGCDRSNILAPIFAYKDMTGHNHQKVDRYLDAYKQNNPLRNILGVSIGEKVTAYYSKGNAEQVTFMAGPLDYTAWLIPLYLSLPLAVVGSILWLTSRRR